MANENWVQKSENNWHLGEGVGSWSIAFFPYTGRASGGTYELAIIKDGAPHPLKTYYPQELPEGLNGWGLPIDVEDKDNPLAAHLKKHL